MTRRWIGAVALAAVLAAGGVGAVLARPGATAADVPQAPPARGAGSTAVTLGADAAVHPRAALVLVQLQRYFDAINAGDYATWQTTVSDQQAQDQSEATWKRAYRSTKDGTIHVDRIDDEIPDGLLVRVRFVSTQDVADAPQDTPAGRLCWRTTLPMEGSPPRISATRGGSISTAC